MLVNLKCKLIFVRADDVYPVVPHFLAATSWAPFVTSVAIQLASLASTGPTSRRRKLNYDLVRHHILVHSDGDAGRFDALQFAQDETKNNKAVHLKRFTRESPVKTFFTSSVGSSNVSR